MNYELKERPIGIFDSGLGGLTMVKALSALLPNENIVYLGDTGRVPYGSRSRETIVRYAIEDAAFLEKLNIKAMVIACNTVCSLAFDTLKEKYDLPIYEVIKAPSAAAVRRTESKEIGVIGTTATIHSRAYENAIRELDADTTVHSVPCPLLVPLVEEGWTGEDDEAAVHITNRYLQGLKSSKIDTLILGCTHYPLLKSVIAKVIGENVTLIDSASETAKMIAADLKERGMLTDETGGGKIEYYVTDSIDGFSARASRFLESDVHGMVKQIIIGN